jgi:hypothetical protein
MGKIVANSLFFFARNFKPKTLCINHIFILHF